MRIFRQTGNVYMDLEDYVDLAPLCIESKWSFKNLIYYEDVIVSYAKSA